MFLLYIYFAHFCCMIFIFALTQSQGGNKVVWVANVDKSFAFDMMTDFCQITTWVGQYLQFCWTRKTWPLRKSYLLIIYSLCEPYKIIIICTYYLDLTQHHSLACSQNASICGLLLIWKEIKKRVYKINVTNFHF